MGAYRGGVFHTLFSGPLAQGGGQELAAAKLPETNQGGGIVGFIDWLLGRRRTVVGSKFTEIRELVRDIPDEVWVFAGIVIVIGLALLVAHEFPYPSTVLAQHLQH